LQRLSPDLKKTDKGQFLNIEASWIQAMGGKIFEASCPPWNSKIFYTSIVSQLPGILPIQRYPNGIQQVFRLKPGQKPFSGSGLETRHIFLLRSTFTFPIAKAFVRFVPATNGSLKTTK
jgi:hypothetical protein